MSDSVVPGPKREENTLKETEEPPPDIPQTEEQAFTNPLSKGDLEAIMEGTNPNMHSILTESENPRITHTGTDTAAEGNRSVLPVAALQTPRDNVSTKAELDFETEDKSNSQKILDEGTTTNSSNIPETEAAMEGSKAGLPEILAVKPEEVAATEVSTSPEVAIKISDDAKLSVRQSWIHSERLVELANRVSRGRAESSLTRADIMRLEDTYFSDPNFATMVCKIQAMFRSKKARKGTTDRREKSLKDFEDEIKRKSPLRTTMYFLIFLIMFSFSVFLRVDNEALYFVSIMDDWVVQEEFLQSDASIYKNFDSVQSVQEFWQYIEGPFVENMFRETTADRTEIFGGTRVVGGIRMRSIRVKNIPQACQVPPLMDGYFTGGCYPKWDDEIEEHRDVARNKSTAAYKKLVALGMEKIFQYSPETTRKVTMYEAWKNQFPSRGGYIMDFPPSEIKAVVRQKLAVMKENDWVDDAVRGVFIEFDVYNKQSSLFIHVKLLVEFYATGGAGTYPSMDVAKLQFLVADESVTKNTISFVLRILVYFNLMFLLVGELKDIKRDGITVHFRDLWNWIDFLNYTVFLVQMYFFIQYQIEQAVVANQMINPSTDFIDIAYLSNVYQIVDWVSCINIFFSYIKFFEFLTSSKSIARIFNTMLNAIAKLVPLVVVLIIMNACFALTFFVGFSHTSRALRTLRNAFVTCFLTMFGTNVGDDWEERVYYSNRYLGTFLIFIYRIIGGYVIVAMFVSLIDESYEDTQEEVEKTHANDVFVANLAIQKNKLQGFLHARFPKVIPEPPKFTMTLRHIARDKELKARNRFHVRTDREILTDLEHRLHRIQVQMLRSK